MNEMDVREEASNMLEGIILSSGRGEIALPEYIEKVKEVVEAMEKHLSSLS